jgi:NADH:ubiquinone oxidoreductase subunit E
MNSEVILKVLDEHKENGNELISILEDIQAEYNYLPEEALRIVAEETGYSLVDIYGVATFYKAFSLKPRGKHLISACLGTACHVRRSPAVVDEIKKQLGIESGETTPDNEFTLETVNCLGACALGPIVVADGHYFSKVDPSKVKGILDNVRIGLDKIEASSDQRMFPLDVNCPRCNHSLMDPDHLIDGRPSISLMVSFEDKHELLHLSSLYGSYKVESVHEIPDETIAHFFCPHCHAELISASTCTDCGASMVPVIIRSGGMHQICSRRGCKGHVLDLNGVNLQ